MNYHFTNEKNAQIIMFLLKAHGIRRVIASPGTTNTALVCSMQNDPHFIMYSSVDERSAAYMACGLAGELNEPVVISCTGATASRNYLPGLTEAYYRKLPILAITSTQPVAKIGHHVPQIIDRSIIPNDVVKLSVTLPIVKDLDDVWDCEIKVNRAILELNRHGGGPVHINLPTTYDKPYNTKILPEYRVINRVIADDALPKLAGNIAVLIGSHKFLTEEETHAIDRFCETNNAVVFCDHTSGYRSKYGLQFSLAAAQSGLDLTEYKPDIVIHIGEVSGDYPIFKMIGKEVWRVSPDGEIRDTFRKLRYIFEMSELNFFKAYSNTNEKDTSYFNKCNQLLQTVQSGIPDLPFSNVWLASKLIGKIPAQSTIHFGILNSLRTWNLFELPKTVRSGSNVGGFGIDGSLSTLIGASLANPDVPYFMVIGDLAFFYDINVLGNRHANQNLRILLVNNGKGTEFRMYNHHAAYFDEGADEFVAAAGHFGQKSPTLVKGFVESLGYRYMCANNKAEFEDVYEAFLADKVDGKPIVFEVFTDSEEESRALQIIQEIKSSPKNKAKELAKNMLGKKGVDSLKQLIKR